MKNDIRIIEGKEKMRTRLAMGSLLLSPFVYCRLTLWMLSLYKYFLRLNSAAGSVGTRWDLDSILCVL